MVLPVTLINTSTLEGFLRIAALSVGLYEWVFPRRATDPTDQLIHSYLLTLPAEWRLYRAQRTLLRPRLVGIFILLTFMWCWVDVRSPAALFAYSSCSFDIRVSWCWLSVRIRKCYHPSRFKLTQFTIGNYGFFQHNFSHHGCIKFYLAAPAVKGASYI